MKGYVIKFKARRVFKQGLALCITLPIDWVRGANISPGDRLSAELQDDGSLLLRPVKEEELDDRD